MLAVCPPELEKKYVTTGVPAWGGARPPGRAPRRLGGRGRGPDTAVHLRAGAGIQVDPVTADARRDRVGSGGDRLRLQSLRSPGRRHLRGDHASHIVVET